MICRYKLFIWLSIIRTLFGGMLVFLLPFVNINGSQIQRIGAYSIALFFWMSILAEIFISYACTRVRKHLEHREYYNRRLRYASLGIVSFFKTLEGLFADIILFLSVVYNAALLWFHVRAKWAILAGMVLFFLSLNMHCIFNGRNYRYYKTYKEYKEYKEYAKRQRGACEQ